MDESWNRSNRMSRRRLLQQGAKGAAAVALTPALASILAACSKTPDQGPDPTGGSAPSAGRVTVNYMVAGGSPFSQVVQKMIPDWSKQSGIDVKIIELPYEQTFSKAVLEAKNRTGSYDVIQMNRPTLPAFAESELLLPLDDYVDAAVLGDLFESHRSFATFGGNVLAVPHSNDLRCLYYRTDLFEAAGLKAPPSNWDELESYAKQLTDSGAGRFGLLLAGSNKGPGVWVLADFIHQAGGRILDESGKPVVNSPEAVEGLSFFVKLLREDKVVPPGTANYLWADTRTLFPADKGAMVVEFNDIIPLLDDPSKSTVVGKYDLALIPGKVQKATNNAGWLVGIPQGANHPKEAGQLIEFILSKEAQMEMCRVSGTLSGRSSVIDALIAEGAPGTSKGDPMGKARWEFYKEVIDTTYELPRTPKEPEIETILGQELSAALSGQKTPQQAMDDAQKAIADIV